jgi:hypothetical protein
MNLIDRDKLYNAICKPSDLPDDVINVCEIRLSIIDQPVVEAIPKKWIINWLTRQTIPALHTCDNYEAVNMMLDDWEKENETNRC